MELYLGTSSWTAPSWQGVFYPPGTPPIRFLTEYSRHFRTVEVDATFYRTPAASTVDGWYARTPAGFLFAAKVPQALGQMLFLWNWLRGVRAKIIEYKGRAKARRRRR
jgi:uncharacterized protein YecE (DUF72 family)